MSRRKQFVIGVNPRDVLVDLAGVSEKAGLAYVRFWMLHALHAEPLPPREEKVPRDEWDLWFRDKLNMKNVRTWIRARDELLRLGKIRIADDGRLYIGRTMRDAERRRGGDESRWGGESDQGVLVLEGVHAAQVEAAQMAGGCVGNPVDEPVEQPGELRQSGEVRAKFDGTSMEVPQKRAAKQLIFNELRPSLSYSDSKSLHELLLQVSVSARARGDPLHHRA